MSKELEALERVQCNYVYVFKARENGKTQLVHDLNTIKKGLKALETIKEKKVDLEFLFEEWEEENWEFALENYNMNHEIELTQEEYDLLKEVLL